jgi:hypothetical protein
MENLTYEEFINNILNTRGRFACGDKYHERHHIIPRCIDGTDDKENLIDLFAREHFIAHKLLAKENPHIDSLIYSWWRMCNWQDHSKEFYEPTPEEYEEARIAFCKTHSDFQRERFLNPEYNPMYGKHHTEEVKSRISKANKGYHHTEEARQKIRESKIGVKNPNYGKCGELSPLFGKSRSTETKEKISQVNKGKFTGAKNPAARKVIYLSSKKIYNTGKEAAEEFGVSPGAITVRCQKHKDFMYYDEWLLQQSDISYYSELEVTNELQTI